MVGGVVGLALIVGLAWFLLRRKARKTTDTKPGPAHEEHQEYYGDQKDGLAMPLAQDQQLDGLMRSELGSPERPPPYLNELGGSNGGVELPADARQGAKAEGRAVHELDASK